MDIPLDVGAARSSLNTNWVLYNFPVAIADQTSGDFTLGLPGVTVDCRTTGQPAYTNGAATSPDSVGDDTDNNGLTAPGGPGLFIASKSGSALTNFIRLFANDITDDNVGVTLRKVQTGEDCDNPDAYRWFLCSPLYT